MRNLFKLEKKEVISFVGAGGKTTTIEKLANELESDGQRVLITTSTTILKPVKYPYVFTGFIPEEYLPDKSSTTVFGEIQENNKLKSKNPALIDDIIYKNIFDYVLIEADGSKRRPIKASNESEPVISNLTTITVGVIGLDCLNKRVDETVHRPEIFMDLLNVTEDHLIDFTDIIKLVNHEKGLFKHSKGRKILLLNKVKDSQIDIASKIKEELKSGEMEVVIVKYK